MATNKKFCVLCNEITEHTFSPISQLWFCNNEHEDGCARCCKCGEELDGLLKKIASGIGGSHIVCGKCRKGSKIKVTSKMQPIIRDVSKKKKDE